MQNQVGRAGKKIEMNSLKGLKSAVIKQAP